VKSDPQNVFARFRAGVQRLQALVPELHAAVDGAQPLGELPGWQALCGKPAQFPLFEGKPCLVATLFGPTGGGKSTVFRGLTGIDVPAGNVTRPVTHACAAAIPAACAVELDIDGLFPAFTVSPLESAGQLSDRDAPDNALYWMQYSAGARDNVWLVLVDVPDMNSVDRFNWERAERMLVRAEIVVLVVYPESYVDDRLVEYLQRCCADAGMLAYVHTKTSREDALVRWDDLLQRVSRDLPAFQACRRDGRSLAEFLAQSPVYYSERLDTEAAPALLPLNEETPAFNDLLKGRDAAQILMGNLREVTSQGVRSCQELCGRARVRSEELGRLIAGVDKQIDEYARRIAGSEFVAGQLLELVLECVEESRPTVVRYALWPIRWLTRQCRNLVSLTRATINALRGRESRPALRRREDLEAERLAAAAESLVDLWRENTRHTDVVDMSMAACRHVLDVFGNLPPPAVKDEWEHAVRAHIRDWIARNFWATTVAGSFTDVLAVIGGTAVVVDLCLTGGTGTLFGGVLTTKLGIVGAAGTGVGVPALVYKLLEGFGLKRVTDQADERWRAQRTGELAVHLRAHLAQPLFMARYEKNLAALNAPGDDEDSTLIDACETVCADLTQLMEEV
jgi:hypothetical protein